MKPTADIVIIGAGIHGCSLAFHLAQAGAGRVVLVEKKHIAAGPTAQSGAMIRALFAEPIYVDLVMASTRMFERWSEIVGGNAGFVQCGFLRITDTLDDAAIGGNLELTQRAGEPYHILTGAELARLVPAGQFTEAEFGVLFPNAGYADPYKATVELANAARRKGVEIHEGTEVTDIRVDGSSVSVVNTNRGAIATPVIVNCSGAWSERVASMVEIQLPIEKQPAPTCLFRKPDSMATIGPILSDGVNKVYLRTQDDSVYRAAHFGHAAEPVDVDNYDEAVPAHQVGMLREGLFKRYNDMRRTPYLGGFTALYDMTPDGHPIVGASESVDGFWNDCGWSGNGFAPAPASGRSLAQMIMGIDPEIDLSFFHWPRSPDVAPRLHQDWVHR